MESLKGHTTIPAEVTPGQRFMMKQSWGWDVCDWFTQGEEGYGEYYTLAMDLSEEDARLLVYGKKLTQVANDLVAYDMLKAAEEADKTSDTFKQVVTEYYKLLQRAREVVTEVAVGCADHQKQVP